MLSENEIARYNRQILLPEIGTTGQLKLKEARVLVVGAGGLGCPVLIYLAAAGVGRIGVIDPDRVALSNLQRQVLYDETNTGQYKGLAAAEQLGKLNSDIRIISYPERFGVSHVEGLLPQYDLVVDCTDNFGTRYLINDGCVLSGKPMVSGAIYRFEGQVSVFNFPVRDPQAVTYRCLFPEPPAAGQIPSCDEAGVLGVLPGIIGTIQATEVIKLITGTGHLLAGKLFLFNALTMHSTILELARNPETNRLTPSSIEEMKKTDYLFDCGIETDADDISAADLQRWMDQDEDLLFVDVRQKEEWPVVEELSGLSVPLDEMEESLSTISREKKVILFCKSGSRGARANTLLRKKYHYEKTYNLRGGVDEWLRFKRTNVSSDGRKV